MKAIAVLSNLALLGLLMTNYAEYDWRIVDYLTNVPDSKELVSFITSWMVLLTPIVNFGYLIAND